MLYRNCQRRKVSTPGPVRQASLVTSWAAWSRTSLRLRLGPSRHFNANRTRGDDIFEFTADHNLTVGQRVVATATTNLFVLADAGEYCTGEGTASVTNNVQREWLRVAEVINSTTVRTETPLIMTNYLATSAGQTAPLLSTSRITAVDALEEAKWVGGTFLCDDRSEPSAGLVFSSYAVSCRIEDTTFVEGQRLGCAIAWGHGLDCVAVNCRSIGDGKIVWNYSTMHGNMNRFRTVGGTQNCGFYGCFASFAAQAFDFTAVSAGNNRVNIRPFARNCEIYRCFEAATSHPGSYQEKWENFKATGTLRGGINIRSLEATVDGFFIAAGNDRATTVDGGSVSSGIDLNGGFARRATIRRGKVFGHYAAFMIRETGSQSWREVEVDIAADVDVVDCGIGLLTAFRTSSPFNGLRRISYSANHDRMQVACVRLGQYSAGTDIEGLRLNRQFLNEVESGSVAVLWADENNPCLTMEGTKWKRGGDAAPGGAIQRMAIVGAVTNTTAYPSGTFAGRSWLRNNKVDNQITTRYSVTEGAYRQMHDLSDGNGAVSNGLQSFTTYTPTHTNTTNISSSSHVNGTGYIRFGRTIMVWVSVQITPTATGACTLRFTPPESVTFALANDVHGNGCSVVDSGRVSANVANNLVQYDFVASDTTNRPHTLFFQYSL